MRLAILFSGQGQQSPEHFQALQAMASEETQIQLARQLPDVWQNTTVHCETLGQNRIAQPFIFAFQLQWWQALRPLLPAPVCAAGYSLGELAACCAAGAFDMHEGITLAAQRAASMDDCIQTQAGLIAIMGLPLKNIQSITTASNTHLAIINPDQHHVIGGLVQDLQHAAQLAHEQGAVRIVRLLVQTPSHTVLLKPATLVFKRHLAPYRRKAPLAFKVLSAMDGRSALSVEHALNALAEQISHGMDWGACLQAIRERQPDAVLEIGPGRALARMWNTIYPDIPARSIDDFRSPTGVQHWLEHLPARR
ncbi:ACP S-malonyltransferase [Advenella mimigardefordensis]|uniref:Putative malonyl CoA-acyl carrier protein transacylase n=1 Tax=Advenella mimigardefordensis (strain DSM 17166 / LMG 22922 / DPN7) TaxID=1247726 RepID=W0P837_ADVMD|nr:ACP S-malonyltransferase [Advenella mimigardefordensis]AHG62891.1 putative malonyl CoA-acyl carrier protein transacylase [Advenella mimigardefordensis DPN7]